MKKKSRIYGGWKYGDRRVAQRGKAAEVEQPHPLAELTNAQLSALQQSVATEMAADLAKKDAERLAALQPAEVPTDEALTNMLAEEGGAPEAPVLPEPEPAVVPEPEPEEPVVAPEPAITLRRKA